jgi:hypothetical protein
VSEVEYYAIGRMGMVGSMRMTGIGDLRNDRGVCVYAMCGVVPVVVDGFICRHSLATQNQSRRVKRILGVRIRPGAAYNPGEDVDLVRHADDGRLFRYRPLSKQLSPPWLLYLLTALLLTLIRL